ncbi:PREDICTED: caspase-14 [Elephantulus edwardii]|uniref:caspase-14 n=1 Tax=Elephantulus edwardii TaxID=28737 RepID=UPI0003F0E7E5|nr:PREDICTED: caspase-14 [Elephantulus edwardii]
MAFLVAGTLRVAAQTADAQESLDRKGRYSMLGLRVALILSSPGLSAATVTLAGVLQALGFESLQQRGVPVQGFLEELTLFREQLDTRGVPIGCALVVLVAPRGQLRRPQKLIRELSCCEALRGRPKLFLLLSSAPGGEWVLQLLAGDPMPGRCAGLGIRGPVFILLQLEPAPSAQYDLSGAKAALLLATIQDRSGAQHDVEALRSLCQTLGFKTTVRTDLTAQAFQEELAQFRGQLDTHRVPVSCALVALMAHGGPKGQLFGADGQEVQPKALVLELSRCWALQGCPKIFLLQACRGGHRDSGMRPTALSWLWRWLSAPPAATIPSHADVLQVYANVQGSHPGGPSPRSSNNADILMVYAAAEGYVAYRDEKGSDFIQTLVEVLGANPGGDLLELMTEVNRRVCALDVLGRDSEEPYKACLEIRSSLRRRLCLRA